MTRAEIIRRAREAGLSGLLPSEHVDGSGAVYASDENITGELERFAHLVAAAEKEAMRQDGWRRCAVGQGETQHCALLEAAVLAEREACAKAAEGYADFQLQLGDDLAQWRAIGALAVMAVISARGQE